MRRKRNGILLAILFAAFGIQAAAAQESTQEMTQQNTAAIENATSAEAQPLFIEVEPTPTKEIEIPQVQPEEQILKNEILSVAVMPETYQKVEEGTLSKSNPSDTYTLEAPLDGIYRLELMKTEDDFELSFFIYDESDQEIGAKIIRQDGERITAELKKDESYRVEIVWEEGKGTYELTTFYQTETKELKAGTWLADSMEFSGQRHVYTIIPPMDGWYRIALEQPENKTVCSVEVYNESKEKIESEQGFENSEWIEMKAGNPYTVYATQSENLGNYQIKVEYERPWTDISGYNLISDSMVYQGQCNEYQFIPEENGRYLFEIAQTENDIKVKFEIFDSEGTLIKEGICGYGEKLLLDGMVKDQSYQIRITQEEGIGNYQMKIGTQKKLVDLSDAKQLKDQMEFEDQINRYHFIPEVEDSYLITIDGMSDGASINMTVFDKTGVAVATGAALQNGSYLVLENAKAGETYEIQTAQEEGLSQYQLLIQQRVSKEKISAWIRNGIESGSMEAFYAQTSEEERELIQKDKEEQALISQLEAYLSSEVIYEFGPHREELKTDTIKTWIVFDEENFTLSLDDAKISEYIAQFAQTYDTYDKPRYFQTYDGSYVTVYGGSGYGWMIDQYSEAIALKEWITQGQSGSRSPIFAQEAASWDNCDLGYNYVEIDLTYQYVYMYIGGQLIVASPCVSGDLTLTDRTTPGGTYTLYYKQSPAILVGEDYEQPVTYWMPFNGGIGLHDATWRGAFGGDIYVSDGSHGCINLPFDAAQTIYENIYAGMPIICYYR